jgi:hypothetical protein
LLVFIVVWTISGRKANLPNHHDHPSRNTPQ